MTRQLKLEGELVATGLKFPKGPVAMPDGSVLVVELAGGRLSRVRPGGGVEVVAELGGALRARGELAHSRVVVFSDLGDECGGDLCDAAEMLLDAGVRLDFVGLGAAAAPACFETLTAQEPPPDESLRLRPPVFRIVAYDPGPEREPFLLAEGRADGSRRRVPAGPVTVLVGFEPPSLIGPMVLSPGTWTHIRVVEFPGLDPPVREWVWSTYPLAPGLAASPCRRRSSCRIPSG